MSKCEKCGKDYYTKECLNCKGKEYQYNQKTIHQMGLKEKTNIWKVLFITLFTLTIIAGAVGIFRILELEDKNKQHIKTINQVRAENNTIKRRNNLNERLVESYKKTNRELQHKLRYCKNNSTKTNNYRDVVNYTKPQKTATKKTTNKQKNKNNYHVKTIYANSNYTRPAEKKVTTPQKKYERYSSNLQLVSDSEITRLSDNRLQSNSSIYGRYYGYSQHNIQCGKEENRYNVVDDCSMYLGLFTDKIYFSKSRKNSMTKYNRKDHMIECLYSEDFGIFHDCRVKIYKYVK